MSSNEQPPELAEDIFGRLEDVMSDPGMIEFYNKARETEMLVSIGGDPAVLIEELNLRWPYHQREVDVSGIIRNYNPALSEQNINVGGHSLVSRGVVLMDDSSPGPRVRVALGFSA